jgi:hypothetical protein
MNEDESRIEQVKQDILSRTKYTRRFLIENPDREMESMLDFTMSQLDPLIFESSRDNDQLIELIAYAIADGERIGSFNPSYEHEDKQRAVDILLRIGFELRSVCSDKTINVSELFSHDVLTFFFVKNIFNQEILYNAKKLRSSKWYVTKVLEQGAKLLQN